METYVSSMTGGKTSRISREKINACIRGMHNVIDSFEEDVTEQRYGELVYDGKIRYTLSVTETPTVNTPVIARAGDELFYVGDLTTDGLLTLQLSNLTQTRTNTVNTIDSREEVSERESEEEPVSKTEVIGTETYKNVWDNDGAVYTRTGTLTKTQYTVVESYRYVSGTYYWNGYILIITTDDYKIETDLTNANVHIRQKYLK